MAHAQATPDAVPATFRPLDAGEQAQLDGERRHVAQVAARALGLTDWIMDRAGLAQLQPLLDRGLVGGDPLLARGLGVVLGDALTCEVDDMDWEMVSDAWGTDPVVRVAGTSLQVGARDMVLKRLEAGEQPIDLLHLLDGVAAQLQAMLASGDYQ